MRSKVFIWYGTKLGVSSGYMQGHLILYMPIYLNAYFDKTFALPAFICVEVRRKSKHLEEYFYLCSDVIRS